MSRDTSHHITYIINNIISQLTNPQEEYLVIEVWYVTTSLHIYLSIYLSSSFRDSDDEQRRKLKSFKGFHHLLRDLRNEDDFLGRTFFLLKVSS